MKISKEIKLELYKQMVRIRTFETAASKIFAAGEMPGFIHLVLGEEAMCAGTVVPLRKDDCIFTTHRGHGHCVVKGADLKRMMAELFGRIDGCCRGRAGSMHFADIESGCMGSNGVVGQGIPIALGVAYAQKYRKTDAVYLSWTSTLPRKQLLYRPSTRKVISGRYMSRGMPWWL